MVSAILCIFLLIAPRFQTHATRSVQEKTKRTQVKTAAALIAFFAGGTMLERYFFVPWVILTGFALLPFFAISKSSKILGVSGPQRQRWRALGVALFILPALSTYVVAQVREHSQNMTEFAEAFHFLGPWGGTPPQRQLASLLESDVTADLLSDLGNQYQSKYMAGGLIAEGPGQPLSFQKGIATKKMSYQLLTFAKLFDPESLTYGDVLALTSKSKELSQLGYFDEPSFVTFTANLTVDQVKQLLQSDNPQAVYFGLLRARYLRDPSYIPVIWHAIDRYEDYYRLRALLSLSVLEGRKVGLDEYFDFKLTGHFRTDTAAVNCSAFKGRRIASLSSADEGAINVCVRQNALSQGIEHARDVESAWWIDAPFNGYEQRIMRQYLGVAQ